MKLFKKVHCKSYLKPYKDGIYLEITDENGEVVTTNQIKDNYKVVAKRSWTEPAPQYNYDDPDISYCSQEIKDLSACDGDCVEKTYRIKVEQPFDGFIVGVTTVDVKGLLGTDYNDNPYGGGFGYCFKEITDRAKVGVVYFRNNCKRYVPIEDIEYLEN